MFFLKIKYLVIVAITLISLSIDVTAANDVYLLIKDRLNLTEEQSEKFEPIILYQWEKRMAVMKKHGISRESNLSKKKIGFRQLREIKKDMDKINKEIEKKLIKVLSNDCLLYTSPSPRDKRQSRMPSSA